MKIINPYTEILTPLDGQAILQHIELCGRVCYKSEDKITDTSAAKFGVKSPECVTPACVTAASTLVRVTSSVTKAPASRSLWLDWQPNENAGRCRRGTKR